MGFKSLMVYLVFQLTLCYSAGYALTKSLSKTKTYMIVSHLIRSSLFYLKHNKYTSFDTTREKYNDILNNC